MAKVAQKMTRLTLGKLHRPSGALSSGHTAACCGMSICALKGWYIGLNLAHATLTSSTRMTNLAINTSLLLPAGDACMLVLSACWILPSQYMLVLSNVNLKGPLNRAPCNDVPASFNRMPAAPFNSLPVEPSFARRSSCLAAHEHCRYCGW